MADRPCRPEPHGFAEHVAERGEILNKFAEPIMGIVTNTFDGPTLLGLHAHAIATNIVGVQSRVIECEKFRVKYLWREHPVELFSHMLLITTNGIPRVPDGAHYLQEILSDPDYYRLGKYYIRQALQEYVTCGN